MNPRRLLTTALATVTLGFAMVIAAGAQHSDANHSMSLTFNRPVSLPGVTLASGTYIFEFPDRTAAGSVVRVLSMDRRHVFLSAFTESIDRPAGLPLTQYVSFSEASPGSPQPIAVWWPMHMSTGQQFTYWVK